MQLPSEIETEIYTYLPLMIVRLLNRKHWKEQETNMSMMYPMAFYQIEYLKSMRIRPTIAALRIYFPLKTLLAKRKQCLGIMSKGNRCKCHIYTRYNDVIYCQQHRYNYNISEPPSVIQYRKRKKYNYFTLDT